MGPSGDHCGALGEAFGIGSVLHPTGCQVLHTRVVFALEEFLYARICFVFCQLMQGYGVYKLVQCGGSGAVTSRDTSA